MTAKDFPLSSLSFLKKLTEGGIDAVKALQKLKEKGKMSKDVVLIFDEMFLQKCEEYFAGKLIGANEIVGNINRILCISRLNDLLILRTEFSRLLFHVKKNVLPSEIVHGRCSFTLLPLNLTFSALLGTSKLLGRSVKLDLKFSILMLLLSAVAGDGGS